MRAASWIRGNRHLCAAVLAAVWLPGLPVRPQAAPKPITIDLAHATEREQKTRAQLEHVLASYDLEKYTFTRRVMIEERAINHAFPVLTLNARFADSPDELLSSMSTNSCTGTCGSRRPTARCRRVEPDVSGTRRSASRRGRERVQHLRPSGRLLPEIRTRASTGTDRRGRPRQGALHLDYKTVLDDESRIAAVVARHHLALK